MGQGVRKIAVSKPEELTSIECREVIICLQDKAPSIIVILFSATDTIQVLDTQQQTPKSRLLPPTNAFSSLKIQVLFVSHFPQSIKHMVFHLLP